MMDEMMAGAANTGVQFEALLTRHVKPSMT